jgi:hypothetical protein
MLPVTWGSKAEELTVARSSESVVSRPAGTSYKSFFFSFLFVVLGFELRAYILSHSISPSFVKGFLR